jgi:hypothetical protein
MGPVGTHSLRKYPSTRARQTGCSKDDVDNRGRWRKRRIQDLYVSVNLPYPDAKVAAALCVGGPCRYALKQGSGWTAQAAVDRIQAVYGGNASVTTNINQMRRDRSHGGHPDLRV